MEKTPTTPIKPLYKAVYDSVKQQIKDGTYQPGTLIPTETELCEAYAVSRTTVRKAIAMLSDEGYLNIKQGRGTEIVSQSTTQGLSNISSITETLRANDYDVQIGSMYIQLITCPDHLLEALHLKEGDEVYLLDRLVLADNRPVAYIQNYLVPKMVPDLEQYSGKFVSLYNLLEQKYGLVLTDAEERISARVANFTDSQMLQIPVGAPILHSRRITLSNGRHIECSISKLVADCYEYSIHLKGR